MIPPADVPEPGSPAHGAVPGPPLLNGAVLTNGVAHLPSAPDTTPLVPALLTSTPTPVGLLRSLRRRWFLATMLAAAAAAIAAAAVWFLTPAGKYMARTLMKVKQERPNIIFTTKEQVPDFGNYQRMQVAEAKSRLVLNAVIRQTKVAELQVIREKADPVEWLEKELLVDFAPGPELMRIAMVGDDPNELSTIVSAVTEVYLAEIVNKEQRTRMARMDQLSKIITDYETTLRSKRQQLRKLAEETGASDQPTLALKHRLALQLRAQAEQELVQLRSTVRRLILDLPNDQSKDKAADLAIPEALIDAQLKNDRAVAKYLIQVMALEEEIIETEKRFKAGQSNAKLEQKRRDLEVARDLLNARRTELRPKVIEEFRQRLTEDARLAAADRQDVLARYQKLEKMLSDDVEKLNGEAKFINHSTLDLELYREEINRIEKMADVVGGEIEALKIEMQAPARITSLEEAIVSSLRKDKQMWLFMGIAAAGAFGLVGFGVACWEFYSRRVDTAEEVVHGLGMKLMGTVPVLPERIRHQPILAPTGAVKSYWQNLFLESVDATRTVLLHELEMAHLHVIMVTSAMGGEGKTSISTHLSMSLARAGRRTLLMDCDLRRPSVHKLFQHPLEPGFCEVIRGEVDVTAATLGTPIEGLSFLPAGKCDHRSLQALNHPEMHTLFERLKQQYDVIIVDSAPILPVADSLQIGRHVDAAIFSVLRDTSRLPRVYTAYKRLAMLGIRILGAVVNGAQGDLYGYSYYGYDYQYGSLARS